MGRMPSESLTSSGTVINGSSRDARGTTVGDIWVIREGENAPSRRWDGPQSETLPSSADSGRSGLEALTEELFRDEDE